MNICVVNGSPKGNYSITLQTSLFLEKKFPQHSFSYLNAGQKIKKHEKDFSQAEKMLAEAQLVIFSYPVYTFLAPAQLHRFIELIKSSKINLKDKLVTQITTSKHFYDVTAHRYIEENCHDLGMKVIHGLSADMEDLLSEQGQKEAVDFFEYVLYCAEHDIYEKAPKVTEKCSFDYTATLPDCEKTDKYDTVIIADITAGDRALNALIEDFCHAYPYSVRIVNISEYPFSGGCLGCFNCVGEGKCIYKDGFDSFLREKIQTANAIIYAFKIKDHSMGTAFKTYDDRQFCNGHRTVTEGMPVGYLVLGDLEREANLRTVIEARSEVGHNFLAGVGVDAATVADMAKRLDYALEHKYVQPRNFYGVGGMKIFRDMIWLMRGLMKADHVFYKKHGAYDFPQKKWPTMVKMSFLGPLLRNPSVKSKMGNIMNEGMLMPYKKVLEKKEE